MQDIPTSDRGKLILQFGGIKCPAWPFLLVAGLIALGFAWLYIISPVMVADDAWYTINSTGEYGSFEWLSTTWENCVEHLYADVGRLSNLCSAPFLGFLPRWIYGLIFGISVWIIIVGGVSLAQAPLYSARSAFWLLVINFIFPWMDFMFTVMYSINYVWGAAISIVWGLLIIRNHRKPCQCVAGRVGLLFMGIVTGWWHEGLSAPLLIGVAVYYLMSRRSPNRAEWMLLAGLALGAILITLAPAFHQQVNERTQFNAFKTVWWETAINLTAFNCVYWLYLVLLIAGSSVKKWRSIVLGDRHNMAIVVAALAFGTISTAIYIKYYNGTRTGLFNQLAMSLTIIYVIGRFRRSNSRNDRLAEGRYSFAGMVSYWAIAVLSITSLLQAMCVQSHLTQEYDEIRNLYRESFSTPNPGMVFHDHTGIKFGIDFLKPSYLLLNTKYGIGEMKLMPAALTDFRWNSSESKQTSNSCLKLYENKIIMLGAESRHRFDFILTFTNGTQQRSRALFREFRDRDGVICTYVEPLNFLVGGENHLIDANFAED